MSASPTVTQVPARLLTIKEAAGRARVSTRTVRRWIAAKLLQAHRTPTGFVRIDPQELLSVNPI
jgi:excisionase family DNA binding protein